MIPEELKKQIDEKLSVLSGHIGGYSLNVKREDIEFGYGLALQQIADKEKERLYWQQRCEELKKVINDFLEYNPERDSIFTLTVMKKEAEKLLKYQKPKEE